MSRYLIESGYYSFTCDEMKVKTVKSASDKEVIPIYPSKFEDLTDYSLKIGNFYMLNYYMDEIKRELVREKGIEYFTWNAGASFYVSVFVKVFINDDHSIDPLIMFDSIRILGD